MAAEYTFLYSFKDREQQVWPCAGPTVQGSDEELVRFALQGFDAGELGALAEISVCRLGGAAPAWLLARDGKYFFNPDVNPDDDTRRWAALARRLARERAQEADAAQRPAEAPRRSAPPERRARRRAPF